MSEEQEQEANDNEQFQFDLLDKEAFNKEVLQGTPLIGVKVSTKVQGIKEWPDALEKVILSRPTKRNTNIYAGNIEYDLESETISFYVASEMPKEFHFKELEDLPVHKQVGTTFADMCWLLSEGTTNQSKDQVTTKFEEGYQIGDITWLLPAKFTDDVVEMMHIMNNFILEGNLYQAIIYGPTYQRQ